MNKSVLSIFILLLFVCSCSKKKETNTIITKLETPKVIKKIQAVGDEENKKTFTWDNVNYSSNISRKADKDLPIVKDGDGNKYYDNVIELIVTSSTGELFRHQFRKTDFNSYIDTNYLKPSKSALMSISFSRIDGNRAVFVATIGSPDTMADEYMLVKIAITKSGSMSLSKIQETE